MRRAVPLLAVAAVLGSALAFAAGADAGTDAGSASAGGAHKTVTVHIADMKFTPAQVQVHPGDTVVWQNDDLVAHTVTGEPISSPQIEAGRTFEWTATKPARIDYICTLHPNMRGTVVVK